VTLEEVITKNFADCATRLAYKKKLQFMCKVVLL